MDAFSSITSEIDGFRDKKHEVHPYYLFEPWDVERRPDWVIEQAQKDGIDLYNEDLVKHVGKDPHPFQGGFFQSTAFFRSLVAATQVGKSYGTFIEMISMLSAEIPVSMRYEKGVDTKINRAITPENIRRFGRFDSVSGEWIDKDDTATKCDEWNCGTVKGAGIYPQEKIAPPGSKIWLGTYMKALREYWWPRLAESGTTLIPEHLIDRNKGNKGFNKLDSVVHLIRDCKIASITYESGFNRFEAEMVWCIVLDEEPTDDRIVQAAQQHCKHIVLVETPYHGITYTKNLVYPKKISPEKKTFHASQYDSPYQNRKTIEIRRDNMEPWDIGARVWGMHTEAKGKPYYDRAKINKWINKYPATYRLVQFAPSQEYMGYSYYGEYAESGLPNLLDVKVGTNRVEKDDKKSVWYIYEEVKRGVPYIMAVDPAEGDADPSAAGDKCAAIIARKPIIEIGEVRPKIVATIRSTLETIEFARVCAHGLRYYNNCTLAAETKRAACNAVFASELRGWPNWYHMVTIQDSTQTPRRQKGFDTNASTRSAIFDLIGSVIHEVGENEYPDIPDHALLRELAACVVGKNGRPDHPYNGTLDSAVCYGIILFVLKHSPEQVRIFSINDDEFEEDDPFGKVKELVGYGRANSGRNAYLGALMPNWR